MRNLYMVTNLIQVHPQTEKVPVPKPGESQANRDACQLVCSDTPGPELATEAATSLASWSLRPPLMVPSSLI